MYHLSRRQCAVLLSFLFFVLVAHDVPSEEPPNIVLIMAAAREKHLHNHKDYQFYDEKLPLWE